MSKLVLLSTIFFLLIFQSAFADYNQSQFQIKEPIEKAMEVVGNFTEAQIESSEFLDQEKRDALNRATDSGVSAGKTLLNLWVDMHQFIVDSIFAGSPIRFDYGIILLIAFVISTVLVFVLAWEIFKKFWKIVIVIVAIIAIFLIFGIEFPTLS